MISDDGGGTEKVRNSGGLCGIVAEGTLPFLEKHKLEFVYARLPYFIKNSWYEISVVFSGKFEGVRS